ncbi:ATP-binding protein [Nocardia sp. NPDC001965]
MPSDDRVWPEALVYLANASLDFSSLPPPSEWYPVPPSARRLEHILGIGVGEHDGSAPLSESLLAGLAGEGLPFAFQVAGGPQGVSFSVGTWAAQPPAHPTDLDGQQQIVSGLLDGLFRSVDRIPASVAGEGPYGLAQLPMGGLAHGIPRVDPSEKGPAPWDRLLRVLQGHRFGVLILAQPIDPKTLDELRNVALEDARTATGVTESREPSPLTRTYVAQLDVLVDSLTRALANGGWRTAVYLLGEESSWLRLSAAWQATFAEAKSVLTPLRTALNMHATHLAASWAMPYAPVKPGPRAWHHPFLNQTLLDTRQLASFAHLPRYDTPGFAVRPAPLFALSRPSPETGRRAVDVGEVMVQRRTTGLPYRVGLDQLTRHTFIAGLTGSGKTNTLMHVLTQAAAAGIPFLVIEPAKTEYRELLAHRSLGADLRVFTVGREEVAPLRLNPFEVAPGVDVSTHLDLLKSVFTASFALWIPLPQVLEHCLVDLYAERGWDFGSSAQPPGDATGSPVAPRLSDLVASVERVVPELGYKSESTQEITASLTTRLNALRRGARGLMLDVERSIPMGEILRRPTVIELEGIGDDADKAFLMGLLLTRLYEHRRAENAAALAAAAKEGRPPPQPGILRHIVVVEEAHRLLGSERKLTDAWHADPEGAFVDTFGQILSEVRAYGQGIVVADQVPVRLAPDVIKNTNLKVVHRLVSGDDRAAMATAMAMDKEQAAALSVFPPGRAAVFSEGDHTPVIVQVPRAKDLSETAAVDDDAVAAAMRIWRNEPTVGRWFAASTACQGACHDQRACREATQLTDRQDARLLATRLWQTMLEHPDGLDVVWPDVRVFVSARVARAPARPATEDGDDPPGIGDRVHSFALHALAGVTARRATQRGWPVPDVMRLEALIRTVVGERSGTEAQWLGATSARNDLITTAARLHARTFDPFPLCGIVCEDGRCPYLHALVDTRTAPRHLAAADSGPPTKERLIDVAADLAADVTEMSSAAPEGSSTLNTARWRAVACAAQLLRCDSDHPSYHATVVADALAAAGWPITTSNQTQES